MPLITTSSYRAPWWLQGGHFQTVLPALFRKVDPVTDRAERLELADGDFLDLAWHASGRPRLAILCHGLEANAGASYMQAMAEELVREGWDVLAWSCRGCGAELNRLPRFYHSGATEDLAAVVDHALAVHPAREIDLIGFSLGGNLVLKYLGERGDGISSRLHRAVAFSVPCDLACSSQKLDSPLNRVLYMRRFIKSLAGKVRAKRPLFPDQFDVTGLDRIRTFREFDDRYTAPLHGFSDAEDYWARSSSKQVLGEITIPALLVNAANDPFLGPGCYPWEHAKESEYFYLEVPEEGGHVGFETGAREGSWRERRVVEFLRGQGS